MKSEIIECLKKDVTIEDGVTVKTVVIQDILWDKMSEIRCVLSDGSVFAALFKEEEKITNFSLVPNRPQEDK